LKYLSFILVRACSLSLHGATVNALPRSPRAAIFRDIVMLDDAVVPDNCNDDRWLTSIL